MSGNSIGVHVSGKVSNEKRMQVIEKQSVSVFGVFVNRLRGGVMILFCNGLEKAYSENAVVFSVMLRHVFSHA